MFLNNPAFWSLASSSYGLLQTDGPTYYVLLDKSYSMQPLIRTGKTSFTDFLLTDATAKRCLVVINGNYYGASAGAQALAKLFHVPSDPKATEIQGEVFDKGKKVTGLSEPGSFWFAQMKSPSKDAWQWTYMAGAGDPPVDPKVVEAVGGVGPLIVDPMPFGKMNQYRPGAPKGVIEPSAGPASPEATHYMIQRSNARFASVSSHPVEEAKTIVAYCSSKRTLLVIVQSEGKPATTYEEFTAGLAMRGFNYAVFLDGNTSSTLVFKGSIIVAPDGNKNGNIDVGIGFMS